MSRMTENGEAMSTAPRSQVLRLDQLVSYQDGSIVSRQITQTDAGNITLFAFDMGQALSEHTTPVDALAHVLEGEVQISIAGKQYHLGAGEAIIMPANVPHALRAVSRFMMLLTMIRS
jgi:quercetin dioxygenase-like cupin family protein